MRGLEVSKGGAAESRVRDVAGNDVATLNLASDIGSPANVAQVLASIPLAVVIIDQHGAIRAFSRQAEEMFGWSAAEIIDRNVSLLTPPAIAERHDGFLAEYRRTGVRTVVGSTRIEMARHREGHQFPIELRVVPLELDGAPAFIGYLRAIDGHDLERREPKSMLAELAQASRVSAMGALATSIAHELNQPLTNIANYTQGLCNLVGPQEDFKGKDEVIRILQTCSQQAVRAGELIHRLRDFVKGGRPQSQPNAVIDLVRDATALAMINGFKRAVHITYDIPANLPPVEVDHLQGQQVVFNLVRNAFEAIDVGRGDRREMLIAARQVNDDFIELTVEDDGPGIAPAIAATLFDSFVTTKGGGMGVGLAICRQIVEAYGGRIEAGASTRLAGAAFRFTLPVSSPGCGNEGPKGD